MPVPIICLDEDVRHFAQRFQKLFSKPQYQYFVTVLLGLMLCEGTRTLSGVLRQIADGPSLADRWLRHFRETIQPEVTAELQRQRQRQPKRRGPPKAPVVTGYLIGDDSTMHKRKGKKMEGLGLHHSTTEDKRVRGHSLVQSLYVLLGRRCPLAPQLYRQHTVCEAEGVPFASKIDLMEATIRTFEPVAGTVTEEECHRLHGQWQRHFTIGEARREIQRRHRWHVLDWLHGQFQSGIEPDSLYELFSA